MNISCVGFCFQRVWTIHLKQAAAEGDEVMYVAAFVEVVQAAYQFELRIEQVGNQLQLLRELVLSLGKTQLKEIDG